MTTFHTSRLDTQRARKPRTSCDVRQRRSALLSAASKVRTRAVAPSGAANASPLTKQLWSRFTTSNFRIRGAHKPHPEVHARSLAERRKRQRLTGGKGGRHSKRAYDENGARHFTPHGHTLAPCRLSRIGYNFSAPTYHPKRKHTGQTVIRPQCCHYRPSAPLSPNAPTRTDIRLTNDAPSSRKTRK